MRKPGCPNPHNGFTGTLLLCIDTRTIMTTRTKLILTGFSLMIIGLCLAVPQLLLYKQTTAVPKAAASTLAPKPVTPTHEPLTAIEGKPVRLHIPSLGIDLPVVDGYYNAKTGKWTLTLDKVQYAVRTRPANNTSGLTFLYGHNRKGVLRDLFKIKLGAEAIIETDNGHQFVYVFDGAVETTPDNMSVFDYQGPPILTVQTCSGLWFQNRQLFTFSLKEVR